MFGEEEARDEFSARVELWNMEHGIDVAGKCSVCASWRHTAEQTSCPSIVPSQRPKSYGILVSILVFLCRFVGFHICVEVPEKSD